MLEPNLDQLRQFIITSVMLMAALLTTGLRADDLKDCNDTLTACDNYVQALEEEKDAMNVLIKQQNERISKLESEANPIDWYWYALGGAATAILVNEVR
jgi:hypothetical protein